MRLNSLGEPRTLYDRVERLLSREDGVEVGYVHGAAHGRLEWRLDLLLREAPPVYLFEEPMSLDLVRAVHAQALCRVARQQAGQDRARAGRDFVWEEERISQDLFVHLVGDFWKGKGRREGKGREGTRGRARASDNAQAEGKILMPGVAWRTHHRRTGEGRQAFRTGARLESTSRSSGLGYDI